MLVDGEVLQALVPLTIASIVAWSGLRPVRDAELQKFVERFGVRIQTADDHFVRARLRRSRAVRLSAAGLGLLVAGLPAYMNLIDPSRSAEFANPVFGNAWIAAAATAALFVEVMVVQWPRRDRRAVIETRRPHDYIASRWTSRLAATSVVAVALAVSCLAAGRGDWFELSASAIGALIAATAAWVGLAQITDRPRFGSDDELRQIDDALRSYGAHHLIGAATALATSSLATAISALATSGWLAFVGPVVTCYGLGVWWTLGRDERWPVRRRSAVT
jgi:hypothetical protein